MKGRIISRVGNVIIASVSPDPEKPVDLKTARNIYGRIASADSSNIGKVFDVIGRTESPYLVIKLFKGIGSNLAGKSINI